MSTIKKAWYKSKTLAFFVLVLAGGGYDMLETFVKTAQYDLQAILLFVVALLGIALRLITKEQLTK